MTESRLAVVSVQSIGKHSLATFAGHCGCLRFIIEKPESMHSAADFDGGTPLSRALCPVHTTMQRGLPPLAGCVLAIARVRDDSQVATAVIQRNVIAMVDLSWITGSKAHQVTMQGSGAALPIADVFSTDCISVRKAPPPPADPFHISVINDGVSSDRAVTSMKRNASSQAIVTHDGDAPDARAKAHPRAERAYFGWTACVGLAADRTSTLNRHRRVTSAGVVPPAVSSSAGVSCVNYTPPLRVTA